MNSQRLAYLASVLVGELGTTVNQLNELVSQAQNAVNSPNEQTQRSAQTAFVALSKALSKGASNQLTPGLVEDLEELTVNKTPASAFVGNQLKRRIDGVIQAGFMSVKTLDDLRLIQKDVQALQKAVVPLAASLTELRVSPEVLEPGESLLAMTAPRAEVPGLTELLEDLRFLNQVVATLSECVDGHVVDPRVITLRSSGYGIDLDASVDVVTLFALIVKGLKLAFDKIREFRRMRDEVTKLGLSEDSAVVKGFDEESAKVLEAAREEIEVEIMQHCKTGDDGRRNELKTAVKFRINGMANRMARGFTFEARIALPPDAGPEYQAKGEIVTALNEIRFERIPAGQPLALPESADDASANGNAGDEVKTQKRRGKA